MHEDEDERPLAHRDHTVVSDDGPAPRKEPAEKDVTQLLIAETLHPWFLQDRLQLIQCEEDKHRQYGKTQLPHWNKKCQGTRVSEQRILGRRQKVEALRNITDKLSDERNLRTFI